MRRDREESGVEISAGPLQITFVTGNAGKLSEVKAMLEKRGSNVALDNKAIDLPELQGRPLDIAREKALTAFKIHGRPVLVEDTSLCFNALGGGELPGPYIRDFLQHLGLDGLNKILVGFEDKSAFAQAIFALALSPTQVELFVGKCHGHIVPPRSADGPAFGWDPVFCPTQGGLQGAPAGDKTFAEMAKDQKNEISHRRRALDQLIAYLEKM